VNQGVLRTEILKKVGGFGETFRDYGIDPDLTAKVLLSGHDVVYTRLVALHHYRNWDEDKQSPQYKSLMQRQEKAVQLYVQKYESVLKGGLFWRARRAGWYAVRRLLGRRYNPNGREMLAGLLPRDWNNVIASRFISPFDPLTSRGKPYHLRQHCSERARPRSLPPDPAPAATQPGNRPEAA